MFIHYGLYSLLGRAILIRVERMPFEEYQRLAEKFNPSTLNMNDWAKLARGSGMRYMCLTIRHHEGFALFGSKASDFNAVTACGRDLVKEYVEACRRQNLRIGLYYSVADFFDKGFNAGPKNSPDEWKRFIAVVHEQLTELMINYGKIDYLFYDGCPPPETWGCMEINAKIRQLQPDILISDRCGLEEDIKSAEQHTLNDPGKLWESCMTINTSWGYNYGDTNWKTTKQILNTFLVCAHNGGNFLLNVGPRHDGTVQQEALDVLRAVGEWLERNGEAVYGTEPHPFNYAVKRLCTGKGNVVYIPLTSYNGPETTFAGIGNRVQSISVLSTKQKIDFRQDGNRVSMTGLPQESPDPLFTVLKMELDCKPEGIPNFRPHVE